MHTSLQTGDYVRNTTTALLPQPSQACLAAMRECIDSPALWDSLPALALTGACISQALMTVNMRIHAMLRVPHVTLTPIAAVPVLQTAMARKLNVDLQDESVEVCGWGGGGVGVRWVWMGDLSLILLVLVGGVVGVVYPCNTYCDCLKCYITLLLLYLIHIQCR